VTPGTGDPGQDLPERVVTLDSMKKSVLTRYRVMAYTTGVLLVLLCLSMIAKYGLDISGAADVTRVVAIAHGWLYVVYLVVAFDLGSKTKMPIGKQLWVLLAGTIPTAAFFVERRISRELEAKVADRAPAVAEA
jgi:integral membrane protein